MMIKLLVAGALVFAWQTQAQNVDLNFTTAGEYTSDFTNPGGTANVTQQTTGGPGGTGLLVNANTGDENSLYDVSFFDFSQPGDTITLSMLTQFTAQSGSGGYFQIGIGATSSFLLAGSGAGTPAYASGRLAKSSTLIGGVEDAVKGQFEYNDGTVGNTAGGQSAAFALTLNEWYLFQLVFVNDGSSSYTMTEYLYDYGANGTTSSTTDLLAPEDGTGSSYESTETVTGSAASVLTSDSTVYAAFRVGSSTSSGMGNFDDFSVVETVPEPQTWVLLGASLLLGINYLRRNNVKA